MKTYIIQIEPEDSCSKEICFVGNKLVEAIEKTEEKLIGRTYISVWENGKLVSEYFREVWKEDSLVLSGKWERNCGAVMEGL